MEDKKKRGCNYTAAEKDILLELVKKFQHIIENKETNATMILKKREAWESVCQQYNAVAVSGARTWQQLRHLYENLKQRCKKNVAKENHLNFYAKTKELQQKASLDKKEINRTGGGAFKSTLSEHDAQILAMVAPQVQPLQNPYDDAALYFGDCTIENVIADDESALMIINDNIVNKDDDHATMTNRDILGNTDNNPGTSGSDNHQEVAVNVTTENIKINTSNKVEPTKYKQKGNVKEQYFKAKLRNANLEYRYLINKNRMEVNKYKLEMQILKRRLKKLTPPRNQ